ncbi:phosphonatase-like hydrolase [soil metagenome]
MTAAPPGTHLPDTDLIVLDMAGTTVLDDGVVERAFVSALDSVEIATAPDDRLVALDFVRQTMGQSKVRVFTELAGSDVLGRAANAAFEEAYSELLAEGLAGPVPGALETIQLLRRSGIAVALTTGFGQWTQRGILDALDWRHAADIALSPEDVGGRGRPHPDLNLMALVKLRTSSVAAMTVVGDTSSDMKSGIAAGAGRVIGVLSGAHSEERLLLAGATHVIPDVTHLPMLLDLRVPELS